MKQIDVRTTYTGFGDNYLVKTDMKRLQQVLLNIFSNAVKFTDRQGKISVHLTLLSNMLLQVKVTDNGLGI